MQLTCTHCQAVCTFADRRPNFCPRCGRALARGIPRTDPEAIGGYRLLRVLGAGGMGKVYEAEHLSTGRRVALKLVSTDHAGDADAIERFRQEGRLAALIAHPRCVFVLAADEENGRPYIVMELMPGDNLDDYLRRRGPLPPATAVRLILDVMAGLREAHRVGVVHRDVKPSNCFFGNDGRLKVGDFGLAKSLAPTANLTDPGSFLGTPLYASPEQVRGEPLDARTDVYSIAATLFCLLTGRAPFQSANPAITLARIACDPPPSLRTLRPELSPALDAVVLQGLERDRQKRWQDLDEFAEALRPFLAGRGALLRLGIRSGAFAVDYGILWVIDTVVPYLVPTLVPNNSADDFQTFATQTLGRNLFVLLLWFLYFGLSETLTGGSAGKWLVGLRVRATAADRPAGLRRGLTRAFLFTVLFDLGNVLTCLFVLALAGFLSSTPAAMPMTAVPRPGVLLLFFAPAVGFIVGVLSLLCTMRPRNGYRGLHEWLSGTRVVVRPPPRALAAIADLPGPSVRSGSGVPERIGPYVVSGAVRWDDADTLLLASDPGLGRPVVLWLRPAAAPPLSEARRAVNRPNRLRWVEAGHLDDKQWDAFVAPAGRTLAIQVAADGPLSWAHALPLLMQLTDELLAAVKDETLPPDLDLEQVWVQPDGRLLLLDTPLTPSVRAGLTDDAPEKAVLALLARVAVLALEGRTTAAVPDAVRAPLPLAAADALGQLTRFPSISFRLRDFRERLAVLQARPVEVTRGRRAGQLALLALAVFFGSGALFSPATSFVRFWMSARTTAMEDPIAQDAIDDLGEACVVEYVRTGLNADPLVRASYTLPVAQAGGWRDHLQQENDLRWQKVAAGAERGGSSYQWVASLYHPQGPPDPLLGTIRWLAHSPFPRSKLPAETTFTVAREKLDKEDAWLTTTLTRLDLICFGLGPVWWVLWAFLLRGGLHYWLAGVRLVDRDGWPAARWRCAARALLVWAPVGGLLLASHRLDAWYWANWTPTAGGAGWAILSTVLWWTAWLLLAAYPVLALCFPRRGPHDRLAGTYLVPR